jgi:hypothetical protein
MNVTEKSLKKEFSALLTEANWTNSDADQIKTLDREKQIRLSDVAYYLQSTYGIESIQPMFSVLGENVQVGSLMNALGISETEARTNYFSFNMSQTSFDFDVTDYKKAIYLWKNYDNDELFSSESIHLKLENGNIKLVQNNIETNILLKSSIEKGLLRKGNSLDAKELTVENPNYKLIIFTLDGQRQVDDKVQINSINGILLLK